MHLCISLKIGVYWYCSVFVIYYFIIYCYYSSAMFYVVAFSSYLLM